MLSPQDILRYNPDAVEDIVSFDIDAIIALEFDKYSRLNDNLGRLLTCKFWEIHPYETTTLEKSNTGYPSIDAIMA